MKQIEIVQTIVIIAENWEGIKPLWFYTKLTRCVLRGPRASQC